MTSGHSQQKNSAMKGILGREHAPYSDLDRTPVGDLSVIKAADCWDEGPLALGRLVPAYLQWHLAGRNPDHLLTRRADGQIDVDDVPGMPFFPLPEEDQVRARTEFLRLMNEQLPNKPEVLGALSPEEIVQRLCGIYQGVTGEDSYGRVCESWCVEKRLIRGPDAVSGSSAGAARPFYYARGGQQMGPVGREQLVAMASRGELRQGDLVWTEGMAQWQPATTIPGLFPDKKRAARRDSPQDQNTATGLGVAHDVRPVSYALYVVLYAGALACFIAATVVLMRAGEDGGLRAMSMALRLTALALGVGSIVYALVVLYRAWAMLPKAAARTSPAKAVGLLLIPLFNLYWMFPAVYGWASDYNGSIARENPAAPRATELLFLLFCIAHALIVLPACGVFLALAVIPLHPLVMWQICRAINYFAGAGAQGKR